MKRSFLLTSFATWLPHQQSNSADDLLIELAKLDSISHTLSFLRLLPVDVQLASAQVLEKITEFKPDGIVCCGMAEKRKLLSVESNASCGESVLHTKVDLEQLVLGTAAVEISHDCGKFVCEGLYYSVLDYLQQCQLKVPCIFIHVPILTEENLPSILSDFLLIIHRLALW
ncbi:MAG: peptidase C15 [Chlorogloeopsis fritschii C42_A2020_084]|uniref:pyroglutamyl-peptidase I family protein n=1 Tax=Chlorogloeopsis fritschii TaxID=1124 RepID=UPI0019F87223|nr:peptidase C15 [Chlorogloeopsis fritschii]MBF2006835.1 peptidase C15 [Chlorogloeopsis fritschii C42_A2020_084]